MRWAEPVRSEPPPKHGWFYLLFIGADEFLVLPVFQFSRSFCDGQRGVEHKQLPSTVCCLENQDTTSGRHQAHHQVTPR